MFFCCAAVNPGKMPYWPSLLYLYVHVRLGQQSGVFFEQAADAVEQCKSTSLGDKLEATKKIEEARKVFEDKDTKKKFNLVTNTLRPYVKVYNKMWQERHQHLD